jgi:catechol 2,3-dioxygenase-like lactoylglutathione lyase family enzyme
MSVSFNHTIVHCRDKKETTAFLTDLFGLPEATTFGPFMVVKLDNGVSLDFMDAGDMEIRPRHFAFLIGEDDFDRIFARIRERELSYWADHAKKQPGEINHHDGGRGVYFEDPNGHFLEIITRPYGGA